MSDPRLPAVSVFGLGYVGCVSAVCLASRGHRVIGVDVNPEKVESLGRGESPIVEEGIGELTADVVAAGDLTVTSDARAAVLDTDISLICVGTPSGPGGSLSTAFLESVTDQIGEALAEKAGWHVVAYRSTMLPGTCERLLIPKLCSQSGKQAGVDFGVCVNPEFLREGTSIRDFNAPPKTVVGQTDSISGEMVMSLYGGLPGPRFHVPVGIAEMTKYVDNSFHALKVGFANEIGAICTALGIDSHELMDIFLADTKLNISQAYLRPGFAFGGSCLPKDVRAITHTARRHDVDIPLLANVLSSNETHLRRAIDMVIAAGRRKVGIFGLSFKPGTDDLRESPMVELSERLIGKGFDVKIHDATVVLSRLVGSNRTFISEQLPHLGDLLTATVDEVLDHGEVLIVGSRSGEIVDALTRIDADKLVIDLVRLPNADQLRSQHNYRGIGW
jgi:GDP-mannose 6-dehydrogenase